MKRVADFTHKKLSWVQPKVGVRYFELRAEGETVATLSFRSSSGSLATAEMDGGSRTFKRVGFLNPRVTVRDAGGLEDLASYHPRFWGGGELVFKDGLVVHWKSTNFWGTSWAFADAAGQGIVDFKPGLEHEKLSDMFKTQATVTISPSAPLQGRESLLVALGLYLLILQQEDATASAGAVVATM
jgi:hypothetical protein